MTLHWPGFGRILLGAGAVTAVAALLCISRGWWFAALWLAAGAGVGIVAGRWLEGVL